MAYLHHASLASPCTRNQSRPKTLLDDISGDARDGELFGVMGTSGLGKSTILDALAGRISQDSLRGGAHLADSPFLNSHEPS
jgi:ABC-type multidrug transport system ATPase subunit